MRQEGNKEKMQRQGLRGDLLRWWRRGTRKSFLGHPKGSEGVSTAKKEEGAGSELPARRYGVSTGPGAARSGEEEARATRAGHLEPSSMVCVL